MKGNLPYETPDEDEGEGLDHTASKQVSGRLVFEWDQAKDAANKAKHHVSLEEAQTVFGDHHLVILEDSAYSYAEERLIWTVF